jgi:hypothetical protein
MLSAERNISILSCLSWTFMTHVNICHKNNHTKYIYFFIQTAPLVLVHQHMIDAFT